MEYATGTDIRQLENFPGQDKIGQTGADQDIGPITAGGWILTDARARPGRTN